MFDSKSGHHCGLMLTTFMFFIAFFLVFGCDKHLQIGPAMVPHILIHLSNYYLLHSDIHNHFSSHGCVAQNLLFGVGILEGAKFRSRKVVQLLNYTWHIMTSISRLVLTLLGVCILLYAFSWVIRPVLPWCTPSAPVVQDFDLAILKWLCLNTNICWPNFLT